MRGTRARTAALATVVVGAAALATSAPVDLAVLAARGRTSLVLTAEGTFDRRSAVSVVQKGAHTFVVSGAIEGECRPLRGRSSNPDDMVARVAVDCDRPHEFTATIETRTTVNVTVRSSGSRLYVDLTVPAPAPLKAQIGDAAVPDSGNSTGVYARARKLAEDGNVRELSLLMSRVTPAQRRDETLMAGLDALMEAAQRRRLELDGALFSQPERR